MPNYFRLFAIRFFTFCCALSISIDAGAQQVRAIEVFSSREAVTASDPDWAKELRSKFSDLRDEAAQGATSGSANVKQPKIRVIIEYQGDDAADRKREGSKSLSPESELNTSAVRKSLERKGIKVIREMRSTNAVRAELKESDIDVLINDPKVRSVLIERLYEQMQAPRPREGQSLFSSVGYIGADDLWDDGYTGEGQTIVILDSGIFSDHEVFAGGKIVQEACFSSSDSDDGDVSLCPNGGDSQIGSGTASLCPEGKGACFHGTHVASIAAGNDPDTFLDYDGVAFDADIIAVQVFHEVTSEEICDDAPCILASSLDIYEALDWVKSIANQYSIAAVNMSLGGGEYFDYCPETPLDELVNDLRDLDILTTIASGNEGFVGAVAHPACIESAITVSASIISFPASWANHAPMVDLLAPGTSIRAAYDAPDGYESLDGTSMASPHVAGAIALLRSVDPTASADQIAFALRATGDKKSRFGWDWETPFIDVSAAVTRLDDTAPPRGTRLLSVVSSGNPSGTLSYLRFYNSETFSDDVRITLIDDQTGDILGIATAEIRGDASNQYQISEIEDVLGFSTSGLSTYTAVVDSDFDGYIQHVVWNPGGASLTNVTSCLTGVTDNQNVLINVHTSQIPDGYPSFIFIHNGGDDPAEAEFRIYKAGNGSYLGAATTDQIETSTTIAYSAQAFLDAIGYEPNEGETHVNFELRSGFTGSIAHIVDNTIGGVITNMSDKCVIN